MESPRQQGDGVIPAIGRGPIRAAARQLFAEVGFDRTTARDIARRVGCTTGAICSQYSSREGLYADLMCESLEQVVARVSAAMHGAEPGVPSVSAGFRAVVDFYDQNPVDLELSLYLLTGMRPRGLTPGLDGELNEVRLRILDLFRRQLVRAGVRADHVDLEIAGLLAEMTGALVSAHTGRLRVIGTDLASVVDLHTTHLAERLGRRSPKAT